jgi:hypothetical protein
VSDVAERYGAGSASRRRVLVGAIALSVIVALAWVAWTTVYHSRPLARSELIAYHIADAHTAEATVTVVRRDRDVVASCLLRATAADHSVVGELAFTVDAATPPTATSDRTIRTEREATSVEMVGCRAEGQSRPR